MNPIRIAFPLGCRVRLNKAGRDCTRLGYRRLRHGTVKSWSRDGNAVLVLWDGLMSLQPWHRDYGERADA